MSEDLSSRVAAIEVHINNHNAKLKELHNSIQDIYHKYGEHSKEFRDILLQLQGVVSEFSEFSVKIRELEEELSPIPAKLEAHVESYKTYIKNDGLFKFAKNNPALAGGFVIVGMIAATLILILSGSEPGMVLLKIFLAPFGVKV